MSAASRIVERPDPASRRVLFIAYAFPPVGGVGVQRVTKFVKYLPAHGWTSSVLTVSNPSVPLLDTSPLRDIPESTIVRKARTFEPGYAVKKAVSGGKGKEKDAGARAALAARVKRLVRSGANLVLQPDVQVLWCPDALRAGLQLLREVPHDVILPTGPPFSSFLLGAALARASGLPLVLDYRDEWGISNAYWENKGQGRLSNAVQQRMQEAAVRRARALIATTPSSAAALGEVARRAGSAATTSHIYNGFDPDEFAVVPSRARVDYGNGTSRFRLACIGSLWNLTTVEPLVAALERLSAAQPDVVREIELVFAGRRTPEQESVLDRAARLPCRLARLPFVEHSEAVGMMHDADALLILLADLPEVSRVIPAKTFEYMATDRPIFVVSPEGDLADIVRDLPGATFCLARDPDGIAAGLVRTIERHRAGVRVERTRASIARFDRKEQAGELARILDRVLRP
jgi:glycosyltransferase involved in cell wall biosynthesis